MSLESPPNRAIIITDFQNLDTVEQIRPKGGIVILQPIAMRIPNRHGIYSPSQLRPQKTVSYEEFLERYANHPRGMWVCFDEIPTPTTIMERSEPVTAYGFGLDCWYIVAPYSRTANTDSEE